MIVIAQQVLDPSGIGGVSEEYNALMNSSLKNVYDFKPIILKKITRGLNYKTIKFYYDSYKKINPDIIQIRGAAIDSLNAVIAAKLYAKSKILVCVHGMYSDLIYVSKVKHFISKNIIEPIIFFLSDGISCVCANAEKKAVFKRYKSKMLPYVYNRGKNFDDFFQFRDNYRKEFNLKKNDILGIYVGRITKEKGIDFLVKALIKLNGYKNFKFFIIGDGDYLEEAKKMIIENELDNNILFFGYQKNVTKYLIAGDIFIQPSLHENHSISLLEASASKMAIICTNVGGNSEIISDRHGILIPPMNVNNMVYAIKKLLDNTKIIEDLAEKAYVFQKNKFNENIINKQLDNVYQRLLDK